MSQRRWSATESRVIEPFTTAHEKLGRVSVQADFGNALSPGDTSWIEEHQLPHSFEPKITLDIPVSELASAVGISVDDLQLIVIIRDKAARRWQRLATWPLAEHPAEYILPGLDPYQYSPGRDFEILVAVAPASELPLAIDRANLPTQLVAQALFAYRVKQEGSRFNIAVVSEQWFVDRGMPAKTVWAVEWHTDDVEREPIACLSVVTNERSEPHLQAALGGKSSNAIATQIAIDIFVEVAVVTLKAANEFNPEPSTLIGTVLKVLGVKTVDQFNELKQRINDDGASASIFSIVRGRVQASLDLGLHLQSAN